MDRYVKTQKLEEMIQKENKMKEDKTDIRLTMTDADMDHKDQGKEE